MRGVSHSLPTTLGIIAGKGAYPRLLAESARKQGVEKIVSVAFKNETNSVIEKHSDDVQWVRLGQLRPVLEAFQSRAIEHVVMVGQITPTHLFNIRPDKAMLELLAGLGERNAHTIFGAIGNELNKVGVTLLPASSFMESAMPDAGQLGERALTGTREK